MRVARVTLCCLAAALCLGASAASAAAQAPEFGRCVRLAGGAYANAGCTATSAGPGKYEWESGPGPHAGFTETSAHFTWLLETNEEGLCTEHATGEYTGPKTVGHVDVVLTGCTQTNSTGSCGTIVLAPLKGEIGVYETGKLGLKLSGEAGEMLAEFDCGTGGVNPYIWRGGSVIVPLKADKMLSAEKLKYKLHVRNRRPEQVPASFLGEAPAPLEEAGNEMVGGEKLFLPMAWRAIGQLVNEEALEANSVV